MCCGHMIRGVNIDMMSPKFEQLANSNPFVVDYDCANRRAVWGRKLKQGLRSKLRSLDGHLPHGDPAKLGSSTFGPLQLEC